VFAGFAHECPGGQGEHDVEDVVFVYDPAGQPVQEVAPPEEYAPEEQGRGEEDVEGHSRPGPQVTQVAQEEREYVPDVQFVMAPVDVQR